jgi:hypothetical protein
MMRLSRLFVAGFGVMKATPDAMLENNYQQCHSRVIGPKIVSVNAMKG